LQNNVLSLKNLLVGGKNYSSESFSKFSSKISCCPAYVLLYVRESQIGPVTETDADGSPPRQLRQAAGTTSAPTQNVI